MQAKKARSIFFATERKSEIRRPADGALSHPLRQERLFILKKQRVVLIHGKDTDPNRKWYPWLKNEVEEVNCKFAAPILPRSSDPVLSEWLDEIDKTKPDENTVLVGHSRGGVAILRWLEDQPPERKVRKVVLVAVNSGRIADRTIKNETNYGFYTNEGYDFEKIKSHCDNFVVLHSSDDEWVDFFSGETNAKGLSARFLKFDGKGHFGRKVEEVPEILEEAVEFDSRKSLLIPRNSRGKLYLQDRRDYKKPDWGFFGGGIEKDETPLAAVLRETKEELDINLAESEIIPLGASTSFWDNRRFIRYVYLYPTDRRSFNVLEGNGGHWMSIEEARNKLERTDRLDYVEEKIKQVT